MNTPHWNRVARKDDHPWSGVSPWLIDWLERYPPPDRSALDLGCGDGDKSLWLAEQGFEVTGIDISDVAIAKAMKKGQALSSSPRFEVRDMRELAEMRTDGPFGLVLDILASQFLAPASQRTVWKEATARMTRGGYYVFVQVVATGEGAPDWVKRITAKDRDDATLESDFEPVEVLSKPSGNLPDTTMTRQLLRRG